jgi:predicted solute-binding protein
MFIIQDWAGNVLERGITFDTFEDAWDHILGDMTDRLGLGEDSYQEYYVVLKREIREKRFLGANDIRKGFVND